MTAVPQNSFTYRMGAGFAGDVNRTHPATIEPNFNDATFPVLGYGLGVVVNAAGNGVRQVQSTDTGVTTLWGVSVRPFPFQQSSATNYGEADQGAATPPAGAIDVLRAGYIMVPINGVTVKGGTVYLWIAATSAPHVQGGFESAGGGGNTVTLTDAFFNGPPDTSVGATTGVGELEFNV